VLLSFFQVFAFVSRFILLFSLTCICIQI